MPKSEVLLYSRSKYNATAIICITLPFVKLKYNVKDFYELAILLTHFMKE